MPASMQNAYPAATEVEKTLLIAFRLLLLLLLLPLPLRLLLLLLLLNGAKQGGEEEGYPTPTFAGGIFIEDADDDNTNK